MIETKGVTQDTEIRLSFNYKVIYKALKQYIDRYNVAHPQLTEKLNAGHRATAELIIRLYLKQLNQTAQVVPYSLTNMPGFRTYASSLATCKGCTTRTILNHRDRLLKARVITAENHHGRDGLDMWINPGIIWKGVYMVQELPEGGIQMTPIYDIIMANRKKIQPLSPEQQEQVNTNSNVDSKCVLPDKCGVPIGDTETGAFDKSTRKNAAPLDAEQAKEAVASALNACFSKKNEAELTTEPEKMPQPCPQEKKQEQEAGGAARIFHLSLVREFWEYAKRVLYPGINFKEYEEPTILNRIYQSVYGRFQLDQSQKEWEKYHGSAIERIGMVRRWLDRSPDHWIPCPDLYFYRENHKNGFNKTWKWYVKQETLKLQVKNQLALQKMKHELKEYCEGKGRHKDKSRYQLFQKHKKQLDSISDKAIHDAYLAAFKRNMALNCNNYA